MKTANNNVQTSALSEQLLLSVASQLRVPLEQIASKAELGTLQSSPASLSEIRDSATSALSLIDNYLLGVRLAAENSLVFETEPVSVSGVIYDTANELKPFAKAYDVELDINISGRVSPVIANKEALRSALVSLGYALIEALPAQESPQLKLQLSSHRCRYGIVAGFYSDTAKFTSQALRQGKKMHGYVRQPITDVTHSSGAGIFIADTILRALNTELTSSRHHRLYGLGTILQPNSQILLV